VAGGDSASALAAGCPVVVKAHPGHPELSARVGEVVARALVEAGAPEGVFAVIHGQAAGVHALQHNGIRAAGFTGSVRGGRALFDIAAARPRPIPFYGELGSVNPVVITAAALEARGDQVLEGYVGSFTLGAGQFCTKPGLVFVPEGSVPQITAKLADLVGAVQPAPMLNPHIAQGFSSRRDDITNSKANVVARVADTDTAPGALLLQVSGDDFLAEAGNLGEECFGPASVLVSYRDLDHLSTLIDAVEPSLTATFHAETTDTALVSVIAPKFADLAGRVLWNDWPTGVTVSWAQQHGGPYPATTAPTTTSVGTAAIERFLRPVAWQGFPQDLLPAAVRDDNPWRVPRRVDGKS
jgi:NADP-dependent aldehyde dehydrogenase